MAARSGLSDMDANGSLEIRIGRLEGHFGAIADKVGTMDAKLDQLLLWASERKGAEQENARHEHRSEMRRKLRGVFLASGVSGLVSLLVSLIAGKVHWTSP
jgi:hypothetical protein